MDGIFCGLPEIFHNGDQSGAFNHNVPDCEIRSVKIVTSTDDQISQQSYHLT